ncbi:bactofilin family protein [Mangrovicoccus ximenensis]|uniref:bactofilin family protein n=1 Tax=Mangrovicoccus ximenensis TaxID=1911570 RepID=UPI000D3729AA|nr:polymer-forming cytoskeletal protein [Mangrovicoccus ximenensis]
MFSKNKLTDPAPKPAVEPEKAQAEPKPQQSMASAAPAAPAPKPPVSVLSSDLTVVGNVRTAGDITVQGKVEGDIRAQLLTVGEGAVVSGEIVADDVVVNGRVIGRVRGLKVRLTSTAKVEGDIIHKTIAIEAGAHFEGSVQRHENPLADAREALPPPATKAPATPAAEDSQD